MTYTGGPATNLDELPSGGQPGDVLIIGPGGQPEWTPAPGGGGSGTFGPATGKVGLTAVNGAALTYMRSDAAPMLDQAIIPTWTGLHTFSVGARTLDDPYNPTTWDGNLAVPTKNAIRDKIEQLMVRDIGVLALAYVSRHIGSDPIALVGLTPINGVAETYIRSDAAPAINQAIAPTWTALHIFSAGAQTLDDPYDAVTWDGNLAVPTKNAIRDKIESLMPTAPSDPPVDGFSWGRKSNVWSPILARDVGDRTPMAPGVVHGIRDERWVPIEASQIDFGTGLSLDETSVPPIVHLQAAGGLPQFLGGVYVNVRGPTQGLTLDSDGRLSLLKATHEHLGGILEPDTQGKQFVRFRDPVTGIPSWQEIEPNTGGINDVPRDPVGEVYLRSFNRWMPADNGGGTVQPRKVNVGGDTMTGPLILSGNATDPLMAVPLQQLSALKEYVDLQDVAERVFANTKVEEAPNDGNPYVRQFRQWERLPDAAAPVTGSDPSAKIGLAAIPGAALTFMRSDAAPAIDQGITPTWTGFHTFNQGVSVRFGLFGDVIETTDHPYDSVSWEGNRTVPTKNAIRDKIESLAGATGANPTALIGLIAVPGVATTFMRSDAASAIDQAIAPTWTALHIFSAGAQTVFDPYDATTWDGNNTVPTKNAIRQKIESLTAHDEVSIGTIDPKPVIPSAELWVDPSAGVDKSVLKAWVQGRWVEVSGSGGAAANPTALIGLTAIPGVAETVMRSDAAPAIDQAIAPTWTALHIFNAGAQTTNDPYDAADWDLNLTVPTKNAIRQKIESLQSNDEVSIGTLDPKPINPDVELWVDPAAGADKSVLKAWVQGRWVEVTSGAGADEVIVSPDEPTDPAIELWFDEDAVPAVPLNEVTIGTVEPVDDTELWYNPDAVPPVGIDYLPLAGGTLIGPLFLPAASPAAPEEAAHKAYVDQIVAASSLYQSIWQVASNVPDLTPSVANPLHSYSWVASTVDPMVAEIAPAGLPGIGGTLIGMNDTIVWNATLGIYEHLKSASASGAYLPLAGGTLSGPVTMGETAGLRWGSTSAQSDPTMLDEGICLYGWGGNSKYGFSVTGGSLNYVVEAAASKHSFLVGATEVMRVASGGATLTGDAPGISFNTVNSSGIFFNSSAGAVRFRIVAEDQHLYVNAGGAGNCIDITRNGNVNLPISNLSVNGRITINANQHFTMTNDGYGYAMAGGTVVYKKSGGGGILRESTGNTRWGIENNSGVWQGYISKQSTREGTVEELITNAITPLLARIATLETALNARK